MGVMTRGWPSGLISGLWLLWALYWLLAARSVKPVRRRETLASRLTFVVAMLLGALLLLAGHRWLGWLQARWIGGGWVRYWIAVTLVVAGLSFSIWARRTLGGNWSGTVTVKVDHELVQTGPYRRIRHPIYTGLLLAVFGSALAAGRLYGLAACALIALGLWRKLRVEERWMAAEFGERYERYRHSSWALIPFVI
jgi:protein-S-isoprenylcysteine O-methyltransferase Ste14